jgi:hypothetical protein
VESILTRANSIELDAGELIKEKLKFPLAMRGFFLVSCNVADCNAKVKTEASFCIVPHPLGASKENAFMGICFIQTKEPEMLKRIGVESILVHPTWSAIEPEKGKFSWNSFDEEMKAYKKNNFQIIGSFPPFPPKWAARALKEKKYDDYAAYIEEYMYQLVNRYKSTIKIWDFWSEADLSIQKNIYGNTEKEQIANYARFIKAGYSGAKRADPDCVFAACGTSGVDCRSLSFSSAVFEHASEYIDAFPVHPYSWPRELGPNGLDAVGPEASGLRKKMEDSKKFINSYGKKQLWIGELGWALDRRTPLDSSYAKEFSNYLVRAFIIARSVPGLTKCIWYTNEDWLANREGDYGLWRWNGNPTPAAAAYAMTSYFLNGVKEITNECKLNLGSNVEGYLFPKKMGFVAAFWSSTSQNIVIDIPLKADKISLFDIMGNPIEKSINKNNESILKLELSNSPVWVVSEKPLSFCSEVLPKISQENQCEVFAKNIRIQQDPLKLDFAFKNSTTLTVLIKNETPQELFGKVKIILPEGEYSNMVAYENLKPGEVRNLDFCITDLAFNKMNHSKMKIIGESNLGNVQTIITPEILSIPFNKSNINVDGDLGDWKNFTPVKLNKVAQLSPPDATAHNAWIGLDDLSANIYCAWDEKNFYFAAEVIDDAHENKYTGRNIYNGDAIQIAFDTGNDATSLNDPPQYDLNNDYEYTLALTSKGPEVFRHFAPVKKKEKFLDIPIAIKRKNKKTLYEVAIPRADLEPFNIQQGTVFGFNFVIFDKDGDGAMLYWLGLSPGIAGGKNPTLFKKFMLGK